MNWLSCVPTEIEWKSIAAVVTPLLALIVAIWLAYVQRKADLDRQVLLEKRKLYRDYLAQVEHCKAVDQSGLGSDWRLNPAIQKLWSLQSEISLVGSQIASEASAKMTIAVNLLFMSDSANTTSTDGKQRSLWDNVAFEGQKIVPIFKKDLEK